MSLFKTFQKSGLCVIPLKDGRPKVQWSKYFDRLPDDDEVASFTGNEYGLICGKASGVIGIDIDSDELAEEIYTAAGPTAVRKRGSKGFTAFYRYDGQASCNWKKDGDVICEILSDKRITTIPPSPHRKTGEPYQWLGDGILESSLADLSKSFVAEMDMRFPKPKPAFVPKVDTNFDDDVSLADAATMLDFIDPGCARDEWVQIGMALRDEYGDAACNLWHEWSSKSQKYKLYDAQSAWRSFSGEGVTIGTLVYFAKQGGYLREYDRGYETSFEVDISYLNEKEPEPIISVGGLVGEIADWITETAVRPQPTLSLAAALTFMGLVKAHRVRGKTDLRTNIMALSLAPTAAGKDYPQRSIIKLAQACGLGRHLMGEPTSGAGMLTGINKGDGVSLLCMDEIGRFIGNISLKTTGGYQREITDYMVKLFSSAAYTFQGKQYANDKENPQIVLHQPHFCCLGSTVPERLQSASSSAEIIDGFLNRWLVFGVDHRPDKQRGVKSKAPPEALIAKINDWMEANPKIQDNYGNPEPAEVLFTPEAWEIFEKYDKESINELDRQPYPINQLYSRSAEHAEKVALVLADDGMIGTTEINLAIKIVQQSNAKIKEFASGIVDNQHEADVIYILDVIKKMPGITKNQLTQRTRRLKMRERNDIVSQLVESGEVKAEKEGKGYKFWAA